MALLVDPKQPRVLLPLHWQCAPSCSPTPRRRPGSAARAAVDHPKISMIALLAIGFVLWLRSGKT